MSARSATETLLRRIASSHGAAAAVGGGGAAVTLYGAGGKYGSNAAASRASSTVAEAAAAAAASSSSSSSSSSAVARLARRLRASSSPSTSSSEAVGAYRSVVQRRAAGSAGKEKLSTTSAAADSAASASASASAAKAAPAAAAAEATAAAAKGGGGGGGGFVAWYESHLQSNMIPTKMVTGGILWGVGDIVAQVVPVITHPSSTSTSSSSSTPTSTSADGSAAAAVAHAEPFAFDYARLARAATFGFALHAPIAHLHYNFLEWMTVRANIAGGVAVPVFKAFMEQFVYWSWFSNSLYHGAMGAMQGYSPTQIYDRIADVLWDTQKAQWAFWIPVQLLNFRFVPVRHQLNVVLLTSVVWTALLSAWYPPEEADRDDGEGKAAVEGGGGKKEG